MAETQAGGAPRSDFCIFMRDGRRYALTTAIAKEVLEARPFTPVPYAPPELLGAFNLRGEVVPLVNLDRFLALEERPASRGDTLLLLCHGDLTLAAVVDQVVIIKHVSPWEIRRAKLDPTMQNPFVRGLIGRDDEQSMVLDGERLLAGVVEQIAAGLRSTLRTPGMPAVPVVAPGGTATGGATTETTAQPHQTRAIAEGASDGAAADAAGPSRTGTEVELPAGGR
jgi:chemotaxis signal transduction protein